MDTWKKNVPAFADGTVDAILAKVKKLRAKKTVYPPENEVFRALELVPFTGVRAVILGQDPYHGPRQAHGLSFSVREGVPAPRSLKNIFKEVAASAHGGEERGHSTDLTRWAEQGVLLLNAVLTVEEGKAGAHGKLGWQGVTDQIIRTLSAERENVVFMLWGNYARAKAELIDASRHLVLEAAHPSPLSASRGFFGCDHFAAANRYLEKNGGTPINW